MKSKQALVIILILGISGSLYSQDFGKDFKEENEKPAYAGRFFTGGGVGFWIWQQEGSVYASPVLGYHLSKDFDVGLRLIYSYYWYNGDRLKFHYHDYGSGIFGRYYLFFFRNLFLHAEYEFLSHEDPTVLFDSNTGEYKVTKERVPLHNIYVGGGYRQWISQRAFVSLLILFNLNETEYSPENPILRIGFGIGL